MRGFLPSIAALVFLTACVSGDPAADLPSSPSQPAKVVIIGLPAITWEDLEAVKTPFLSQLISKSAIANVSVRVSNEPADAYATLGAGKRTETDPSAGWFFNSEETVENGTGRELWARRNDPADAGLQRDLYLSTTRDLVVANRGRAFEAVPGRLGKAIVESGRQTAAVGNGDIFISPLPNFLPSIKRMQSSDPPETGIHREAGLAVMHTNGTVNGGDVSRALLRKDRSAPFGISTNPHALLSAYRDALAVSSLVVVETGDTERIDRYTQGLADEHREVARRAVLARVLNEQVRPLVNETGPRDLIVILAPTTPGGPEERGQLRPAILTGAGIPPGVATSQSTGRPGLITLPDLTATIARTLRLDYEPFNPLHEIRVLTDSPDASILLDQNTRAVVHDAIRAPVSIAIILLHLAVYVAAVTRQRRELLRPWLGYLLLVALAFPIASFISTFGLWKLGVGVSFAAVVISALLLGLVASLLGRGDPQRGPAFVLGLTSLFLFVDLALGATSQLDSVLGYTSVAAGRFYGLGNLGFALFASSVFLVAAIWGDAAGRRRGVGWWGPLFLLALALLWIGHPQLGDDVGGVLTMVPAMFAFAWAYFGKGGFKVRHVILIGTVAVFAVIFFGLLDLLRPASDRTHLGQFMVDVWQEPVTLWVVARRKIGLAITLTFAARWGLAVPGAIGVLIWLYRRSRGAFKEMLVGRDALRAGLHAVFVAAVVGSLVNDSGLAVAGMMLAVATPWALLRASVSEAREAS